MANTSTTNKDKLLKKVITLFFILCFCSPIFAQKGIQPRTYSIRVAKILDSNFLINLIL